MVQFATLQEGNIEVLPFDISREKALSDKQLHRALEEKAKEYVIGEDQSSEIQLNVFPKTVILKNLLPLLYWRIQV